MSISLPNSLTMIPNSKKLFYQCKVCGAPSLHMNYGVMTCDSCKIFFKRNVTKREKKLLCQYKGNCDINPINRRICSACRLEKCFQMGMQVDLFRCPRLKMISNKQQRLSTLNLLKSDNSTLTQSQWMLLSNLIYNYDEKKLVSIAEQFLNHSINDQNLAQSFFRKTYEISGEYINSNPDLLLLSNDDCSIVLRNIADNITCLGTAFCWNWSRIYNYQSFMYVFEKFYGLRPAIMIRHLFKFIDPDIVVAKLSLSLFAFSNNISIFSSYNITKSSLKTFPLFYIQNIYVEILWKYLIYKYGYYHSIQRFINLIQCLLAAINIVYDAQDIKKHTYDIESLVEQTELTFILEDIERIE